jgi:hypothetical protein
MKNTAQKAKIYKTADELMIALRECIIRSDEQQAVISIAKEAIKKARGNK